MSSKLLASTLMSKNILHNSDNNDNGIRLFDYNFFRDELSRRYLKFKFDEKSTNHYQEKDGTHIYGLKNAKFSNLEQFLADAHGIMVHFRK